MKEFPWMAIAREKLGIHEIAGPEADGFIVECLKSTTVGYPENESDEIPWCSAFVNRILQLAGYEGTNSAWARNWLEWGVEADWGNLIVGSIVVLQRGENSGHVGFFVDSNEDSIKLLGGNQHDSVSYAWFPQSRILGIRVQA